MLSWARRERLSHSSVSCRILAARIDQLLTDQVVRASRLKYVSINDIYVILWELESIVDHFEELLLQQPERIDLFITQTLQDAITMDTINAGPLPMAKYELFRDWMELQRNLLVSWLCYTRLPTNPLDFWIVTAEKQENNNWDIWHQYSVVVERLPALLVSEAMAAKFLFVGTAVRVLKLAKKMNKEREIWLQQSISQMFQHQESTNKAAVAELEDTTPVSFKAFFGHWNVLEATVQVNFMASWAANALYDLVMVQSSFLSHLEVLREFYFLQDGFFYRNFLSLASGLLELTPGLNAEHDMNVFFQESAVAKQFLGEDSKSALFHNLRLTFTPSYQTDKTDPNQPLTTTHIARLWSDLSLDYNTEWPLNLILTPPILRQYNEIFQFLFHVKRTQVALQLGWQIGQQKTPTSFFRLVHRFQMLRHQMGYFIDALSQYLHVDVFSAETQALDEKLANCKDFEDLLIVHQQFLTQLSLQCFLSVPTFKRAFASMFDIIGTFNGLMRELQAAIDNASASTPPQSRTSVLTQSQLVTELEVLMKEWFKHTKLLRMLLSGVKGQAQHLNALLLLFDYSLFWSENERSLLELESDYQLDAQEPSRMAHAKQRETKNSVDRAAAEAKAESSAPSTSSTSKTTQSSDTTASKGPSKPPKLTTASRVRAASAAEAEKPATTSAKASGGPPAYLLARLMKKTHKN